MKFIEGHGARLDSLLAAEDGLTSDQRASMSAHLLGALACYVDDEKWAELVEDALKSATRRASERVER